MKLETSPSVAPRTIPVEVRTVGGVDCVGALTVSPGLVCANVHCTHQETQSKQGHFRFHVSSPLSTSAWIKAKSARPLRLEELAQVAGIAVSTLHHHFRALMAMGPLQYQKQIRLQVARARLLADDVDAATVAFEVGYESASQFNREYSRLFGQPPLRDVRALRSPNAPTRELVTTA